MSADRWFVRIGFIGFNGLDRGGYRWMRTTLTFDNDMNKTISILGVEAKATGEKYKNVYSSDFKVVGGKKKTRAIETNAGCALPHHLRVKYEKGKNTLYKTKGPLATAFDKKYTFEFDD